MKVFAALVTGLLVVYSAYFQWDWVGPLFSSAASSLAHPVAFFSRIETPGAGEEALPSNSREAFHFLERFPSSEYDITQAFSPKEFSYQQIVANAWPSRLVPGARHRLLFVDEMVPAGCTTLAAGKEMRLIDCPH